MVQSELAGVPPRLLSVEDDGPRLIGTTCDICSGWTFPAQNSCARCGSDQVSDTLLPNAGTLWSFTIQTFRPPSPPYAPAPTDGPDNFVPFGVGMIEFQGGRCVHGRLDESDRHKLRIGMAMRTVIVPANAELPDTVFAFQPVAGEAA